MRYAYQLELHEILIRTNSLVGKTFKFLELSFLTFQALRETSTMDPRTDRKKQMPVVDFDFLNFFLKFFVDSISNDKAATFKAEKK